MEKSQEYDKRVKGWKIPLFKMYNDEKDAKAVSSVIKRGTEWTEGPEVRDFEKKFSKFMGMDYSVSFNSGTSGLHALLIAYGVEGKEVIVPSFTFISTVNAVVLAGGIPVFAECEDKTFGLDANDVSKKVSSKTKAILVMHYGGCCAKDIEKLRGIAGRHKLILIEDAAESLDSSLGGKKAGTFGHAAMFSFCQNKLITCGEGGMVVTDDKSLYEKMKMLRSHGRVEMDCDYFSSVDDNDYLELGYNYRMPSINAALGLSQMEKMEPLAKKRRQHAFFFNRAFRNLPIVCPIPLEGFQHVYQLYTIILASESERNGLQQFLKKKGIMTKIYFNPVHLKSFYRRVYKYKEGYLPNTESLSKKVLTLPLYVSMSKKDLDYISKSVKEFFAR